MKGLYSANTQMATKRGIKVFRYRLSATARPVEFKGSTNSELDTLLETFWLEARTKDNQYYKRSSLQNVWLDLNRHLQATLKDIDLIKGR